MNSTVANRALGVAIVVLLGVAAWFFLDVGKWLSVRQNLHDICAGNDTARARQNLLELGDRAYVIEALKDELGASGDSIKCKKHYLETFGPRYFNQPRVVDRALESDEKNTRRAAAALRYGNPAVRDQCGAIAMEWLEDTSADSRYDAALIARQLKLEAAVPIMLELLDMEPDTPDDLRLLQHALSALKEFKPAGLTDKLTAMVAKASLGDQVQGLALETLSRLEDAPRDEVRALAIRLLTDRNVDTVLRFKAASVLATKEYVNEESSRALESVLMDEAEKDTVVQNHCLSMLGNTIPAERYEKMLLDRRIYTHPYFGIRIKVATGLSALNVREGIAYDILCEYLTDVDKADTQFHVRKEAWLSLWTLTGMAYGPEERDLFLRAPKPFRDREAGRTYRDSAAFTRPGVTRRMTEALQPMVENLARMKEVRQTYLGKKAAIRERWETERNALEVPKKEEKEEVEPVGPTPPPKDK